MKRQTDSIKQDAKRPRTQNRNNRLSGVIERIHCKNFMCHQSLEVHLNSNVNFIVGRNGSGKSAILTALIVVLGGKASDTNRSTSIKSFIKNGCNSAVVEITIANDGKWKHKPDVYGQSITIVRNMYQSGSSSYKIKSDKGAVISTKKDELIKIVRALKLFVDNPLCVLTQDTARTFLNSSDSKKKYTFFMKATNMENILNMFNGIIEKMKHAKKVLWERERSKAELDVEVEALGKKLAQYMNIDAHKERLAELKNEIKWSALTRYEAALSELKDDLEEKRRNLRTVEEQINNKEDADEKLSAQIEIVKDQIKSQQAEITEMERVYNTLRSEVNAKKEAYQMEKTEYKSIMIQIRRLQTNFDVIVQEIEKQKESMLTMDSHKAKRDKDLQLLADREKEYVMICSTAERDLQAHMSAMEKVRNDLAKCEASARNIYGKVAQLKSLLNQLGSQSNNSLALYGAHMPQLIALIQKAFKNKEFKSLPRGPVGDFMKVKDKKWSSAIEQVLGAGMLLTFLVDNAQDRDKLRQLIKQHFPNIPMPNIRTSKFFYQVHNIGPKKVRSPNGTTPMLDMLSIKDPVVTNFLIDQLAAETILLCEDNQLTIELMRDQRNVPVNCQRTILLDGTTYYPDPNYRSYAGNSRPSRYIQISVKERAAQLEADLSELMAQQELILKEKETRNVELNTSSKESRELNSKIQKYEEFIRKIQSKAQELKEEELPSQSNMDILNEEHQTLLTELSNLNTKLNESANKIKQLSIDAKEDEEKLAVERDKVKKEENKLTPMQGQLQELTLKRNKSNSQGAFAAQRLKQASAEVEKCEEKVTHKNEKIAEIISDIDHDSERVEDPRSEEELKSLIREVESAIRSLSSMVIDPEALKQEYELKNSMKLEMAGFLKLLQESLSQLTTTMGLRFSIINSMKATVGSNVKHQFLNMLKMRKYNGTMNIDHDSKTLDILIDPKKKLDLSLETGFKSQGHSSQGQASQPFLDLRSLSGGERSYCTVSFLIALWNSMSLPFYFLDEFDVFMDQMNRKVVMDVLLANASNQADRQFVFLTPQDTSKIAASDTLTIHKMADPDRK